MSVSTLIYKEQYYKQLSIFTKDNEIKDNTADLIKKLNELAGKNIFLKAKDLKRND